MTFDLDFGKHLSSIYWCRGTIKERTFKHSIHNKMHKIDICSITFVTNPRRPGLKTRLLVILLQPARPPLKRLNNRLFMVNFQETRLIYLCFLRERLEMSLFLSSFNWKRLDMRNENQTHFQFLRVGGEGSAF